VEKFMCHGRKEKGSIGVGVTIESYGKVEISYINVDYF
jgi:pantoate kinase